MHLELRLLRVHVSLIAVNLTPCGSHSTANSINVKTVIVGSHAIRSLRDRLPKCSLEALVFFVNGNMHQDRRMYLEVVRREWGMIDWLICVGSLVDLVHVSAIEMMLLLISFTIGVGDHAWWLTATLTTHRLLDRHQVGSGYSWDRSQTRSSKLNLLDKYVSGKWTICLSTH